MKTERDVMLKLNNLSDKERRALGILEILRKKTTVSRTEISKITGINMVSISNYIKNYIEKDIILEKGYDVSTGGRKPELIELNVKGNYFIGLHFDDRTTKIVLTDLAMNVKERAVLGQGAGEPVQAGDALTAAAELVRRSGIDPVKIKGVGAAGPRPETLAVGEISGRLNAEVFAGKDAVCGAFAERKLNPEADVENLLYIFSDLGEAVMIRDDNYFSAPSEDGVVYVPSGIAATRDKNELYEHTRYLRPWNKNLGVVRAARDAMTEGVGTAIVELCGGDKEKISRELVIEAALANDDVASDIVQRAAIGLGIRAAYLINLFSPDVVVIGGGVESAGELVLSPVRKMVSRLAFARHAGAVRIMPSSLGEDAVSLGAIALAIREIFLKA